MNSTIFKQLQLNLQMLVDIKLKQYLKSISILFINFLIAVLLGGNYFFLLALVLTLCILWPKDTFVPLPSDYHSLLRYFHLEGLKSNSTEAEISLQLISDYSECIEKLLIQIELKSLLIRLLIGVTLIHSVVFLYYEII